MQFSRYLMHKLVYNNVGLQHAVMMVYNNNIDIWILIFKNIMNILALGSFDLTG